MSEEQARYESLEMKDIIENIFKETIESQQIGINPQTEKVMILLNGIIETSEKIETIMTKFIEYTASEKDGWVWDKNKMYWFDSNGGKKTTAELFVFWYKWIWGLSKKHQK
jgi:hypothetical protein